MNRGNICLEKPRNDLEFSVRTAFFSCPEVEQYIAIRQIRGEDPRAYSYFVSSNRERTLAYFQIKGASSNSSRTVLSPSISLANGPVARSTAGR